MSRPPLCLSHFYFNSLVCNNCDVCQGGCSYDFPPPEEKEVVLAPHKSSGFTKRKRNDDDEDEEYEEEEEENSYKVTTVTPKDFLSYLS